MQGVHLLFYEIHSFCMRKLGKITKERETRGGGRFLPWDVFFGI